MRRSLLAGIALLPALNAHALSGEEMFNYCEANACGGYFVGAFDALQIIGAVGSAKQQRAAAICPPDALSDEQKVDVALAYLQSHPQQRFLQAANLALRAWRERWPCERTLSSD